jgi:branched-chain amino acid transport system permease protein
MKPPAMDRRAWVTLIGLAVFALLPLIAEWVGNPFLLDIALRIMVLSIAAISLNLILGYGGMISFGHSAFIGIGAYAVGIPAYYGVYNGFLQMLIAVGGAALFAFLTGLVCLRTRGVYFIMITLAFAQMVFFAFVSIEEYGGDDGLVIEVRSELSSLVDLENNLQLYYLAFALLLATLYIVRRVVNSRFGMVIRGSKFNDQRMQAVGFNTFRYRLTCYVIAGAICGMAGWLLGNFTNFISPEMMDWTRSGELIFMVVLGGAGSLFGPVMGASAFIIVEELLSGITVYWQLIFGLLLIAVVLFVRGGLDGLIGKPGHHDE